MVLGVDDGSGVGGGSFRRTATKKRPATRHSNTSSTMAGEPLDSAADIGVGFSDTALLAISVAGFCALAAVTYSIVLRRLKTAEEVAEEDEPGDYEERLVHANVAGLTRAERRARARAIMKQQRRAEVGTAAGGAENAEGGDEGDEEPVPRAQGPPAMSRKDRQRAAKATEREERRLFEEERRQQQKHAQLAAHEEKLRREREEEQRLQEEKRRRRLEEEAQEAERQHRFRTFLESNSKTLSVDAWLQSLQDNRVVDIDELAKDFAVRTEIVQDRIKTLLSERRVAGVFDSGVFIALNDNELRAIAEQIENRGHVTTDDVVEIYRNVCAGV